jgi:lipoate-protein ligase B
MEKKKCIAVWCGQIPYKTALDLQMQICGAKKDGWDADVLLLLEHPPTITRGRNAKQDHLLAGEALLKSRGVELWDTDRGGDITYHGPGQLVGYPILALGSGERDVHGYMWKLEDSLIRILSDYGVEAKRDPGFTGVWTGLGKIAAMGVHISRWITRHGFALNVTTDLSYYDLIVPCGIVGRSVTSMQTHLSRAVGVKEVAELYVGKFATVFHRDMVAMNEGALRDELRDFAERAGVASKGQLPSVSAV